MLFRSVNQDGVPMQEFYLMWVAGKSMPKRVHETIESARAAAAAYKELGGTRQCFILKTVEATSGRKLLTVKPKMMVEPKGKSS